MQPKIRMHRNLHRKIGINRLERRRVRRMIDVVEPHSLRQRRMQHRRVVRLVQRAKSRSERAHARIAIHLQIENLHRQRVPRLRSIDEKWPRQRIIPLGHAERIPRLLQRIAKAVERIRIKDVARFDMRHRRDRGK
jgi:hypothetical protein